MIQSNRGPALRPASPPGCSRYVVPDSTWELPDQGIDEAQVPRVALDECDVVLPKDGPIRHRHPHGERHNHDCSEHEI